MQDVCKEFFLGLISWNSNAQLWRKYFPIASQDWENYNFMAIALKGKI